MPATPHTFQGQNLLLDPAGILLWPERNLLAVADLHLEKGSACAARGQLVPPYDSAITLAGLSTLIRRYAPGIVIAVGDSFHDTNAAARLSPDDLTLLANLTNAAHFIWVRGNHDPEHPPGIAGETAAAFTIGPLIFRHEAQPDAAGEISGHFHPKARVATRAATVARPCFMCSGQKIILPSFGAYTGGLEVGHPAIARHFPDGGHAYLLGRDRVFGFAVPAPETTAPLVMAAPPHRFG